MPAALCILFLTCAISVGVLLAGQHYAMRVSAGNPAATETLLSTGVFGLLAIAGVLGGAATGVNSLAVGPHPVRDTLTGFGTGLSGLLFAVLLAGVAGSVYGGALRPVPLAFLWGSVLILFQATSEEVLFRGYLQQVLTRHLGAVGIVVTALLFAGMHAIGREVTFIVVLNMFLGGAVFGLLAARHGGIGGAVAAHFAWNWGETILLGLDPNPGRGNFGSMLDLDLLGASLWGGSEHGLNGSLGATFALVAIIMPLALVPPRSDVPSLHRSGLSRV